MIRKNKILCLISMLLLSNVMFGTGQFWDLLIYKSDTLKLISLPIKDYSDTTQINPRTLFKSDECLNAIINRGYESMWKIQNDSLFLLSIKTNRFDTRLDSKNVEIADLKLVFPGRYQNGKVLADWFSGSLYCPEGKYVFEGADISSREKELELIFQNGMLIGEKMLDNSKSQQVNYEKLFTEGARSYGKREYIESLINWKDLPPIPGNEVRTTIRFSANEDGVIDDIKVVRGCAEIFDNEAVRIVKTLPPNVQFYHGKLLRYYYTLPVVFKESTRLSKISKK